MRTLVEKSVEAIIRSLGLGADASRDGLPSFEPTGAWKRCFERTPTSTATTAGRRTRHCYMLAILAMRHACSCYWLGVHAATILLFERRVGRRNLRWTLPCGASDRADQSAWRC